MDARTILNRNYEGQADSFLYRLYAEGTFSIPAFWEYYDSLDALAADVIRTGRDFDIASKINTTYRRILQAIISHFDRDEPEELADFPADYGAYLERLDGAVESYSTGAFLSKEWYTLQR